MKPTVEMIAFFRESFYNNPGKASDDPIELALTKFLDHFFSTEPVGIYCTVTSPINDDLISLFNNQLWTVQALDDFTNEENVPSGVLRQPVHVLFSPIPTAQKPPTELVENNKNNT